ncbi:MAG: four helix bundle protein [Chrysiogenetes bacterium]|nr:four helix bundle protein [Chrysiogenetes bacterium]
MSREWEANRSGNRGERRWGAGEPRHSEQSGPRQPRGREVEGNRERDRGRARARRDDGDQERPRGGTRRADGDREYTLSHERLDVYQAAIELVATSARIIDDLPRGSSFVSDQLRRAALSVPLNIAEGGGKPTDGDRKRFLAIARGSAMECGAILDAGFALQVIERDLHQRAKALVVRLVAMLSKMCR